MRRMRKICRFKTIYFQQSYLRNKCAIIVNPTLLRKSRVHLRYVEFFFEKMPKSDRKPLGAEDDKRCVSKIEEARRESNNAADEHFHLSA